MWIYIHYKPCKDNSVVNVKLYFLGTHRQIVLLSNRAAQNSRTVWWKFKSRRHPTKINLFWIVKCKRCKYFMNYFQLTDLNVSNNWHFNTNIVGVGSKSTRQSSKVVWKTLLVYRTLRLQITTNNTTWRSWLFNRWKCWNRIENWHFRVLFVSFDSFPFPRVH